jgi:hypothetical protein
MISGEAEISKRAVDLFYGQIDVLIDKRLEKIKQGYKTPDGSVDLLDLFIEATDDRYTLGGMVFGFLAAGRKSKSVIKLGLFVEVYDLHR